MKIFTKSMLTLLLLCFAGVVNAQETIKGWFEVDVKGYANEARDGVRLEKQEARTEDGAYVVYARSKDDAVAAGDMPVPNGQTDRTDPNNYVDWDTQFFLDFPAANAVPNGGKFRLRMKIKADKAISVGTQSHKGAGNYIHWACVGDVPFTEDWVDYDSGEKTASSEMDGFYCIAFQLGQGIENTYYFKDIVLEVYGDKPATPTAVSENAVWTSLIQNGDLEGTENTSFRLRQYPYEKGELAVPISPVDGVGVDGSRGLQIASNDKVANDWDTQFWITFNESVPEGTRLRVKFDYRSENDVAKDISTQAHTLNPGGIREDGADSYNHYDLVGSIHFTPTWATFSKDDVVINSNQSPANRPMGSIAFNFNDSNPANTYYLDNISVDKYALLNEVKNDEYGGFRVLFTEFTNMPDLVKALVGKKKRAVLPEELAKAAFQITINGTEAPVESVEYDTDGSLYVFLSEDYPDYPIAATADVKVKFTNPTDAKYQLKYTRGANINTAVENFEMNSVYDGEIDMIPNSWLSPSLESSEPENGSFCLPASISTFTLTFDKGVKANLIEAKLDDTEKLTVAGDAENNAIVILTRKAGAAALAEGKHTINVTKVFSLNDESMYEDSPAELTFSIGEAAVDEKLQRAIDNAAAALEESSDGRYQGEAYAALKEAYEKYSAEAITYTAPSQVDDAKTDLSVKTEAQSQHYTRCNDYDNNLQDAEALVSEYADSKFNKHELFGKLSTAVGKYSGKQLTDDAELKTAIDELKGNVAEAKAMFTDDWTESKSADTGIKVLVERIRTGVEALLVLGYDENDEAIVAGKSALDDNDDIAQMLKNHVTKAVYDQLKDEATAAEMFKSSEIDQDTGEEIPQKYDMTVFIKNPNIYKNGNSIADIPGWTVPTESKPGIYGQGGASWGSPRNVPGLPEDVAFTTWHPGANMRMEQTITDLPAGVYVVEVLATDWANANEGNSFAYAKASDAVVPEEGAEPEMDVNYTETMLFEEAGNYQVNKAHDLAPIEVKDGTLTIGAQFGAGESQYMFEGVRLYLVGAAEGFNYVAAAESIAQGIKNANTSKVRSISMFDLNGRSVKKASKGIVIVKKVMGDGTVQTQKIVK